MKALLDELAQDVRIELIDRQVSVLLQRLERMEPVELQSTGGFHPNQERGILLLCATSHQFFESVVAPTSVVEAELLANFAIGSEHAEVSVALGYVGSDVDAHRSSGSWVNIVEEDVQ